MEQYMEFLLDAMEKIDSDPIKSLQFFTTAMTTTNITNKPVDNVRMLLIEDVLRRYFLHTSTITNEQEYERLADNFVNNTLQTLNAKYEKSQHLCWKSHEHHFHANFQDYVNCPITCLCELGEFLKKLRF